MVHNCTPYMQIVAGTHTWINFVEIFNEFTQKAKFYKPLIDPDYQS